MLDKGHVFICGYEDDTVAIVEKLQEFASSGIAGYTQAVERWLDDSASWHRRPGQEGCTQAVVQSSRVWR